MKLILTSLAVSTILAILAITACTQKEDTTSVKEEVKTETTVVETKETSQEAPVASETTVKVETDANTTEGVKEASEASEKPVESDTKVATEEVKTETSK